MRGSNIITIIGAGLILIGGLFLLQTFGVISGVMPLLWAVLFATAGGIFFYVYWTNRQQWWTLIPGFALLGLGILIALAEYGPSSWDQIGAAIFLGSIGLGFLVVYFLNHDHWWAIIPGGVVLSVAIMIAVGAFVGEDDWIAAILFFGMTLTFVALAFLPSPTGRMTWAFIPAVVLFLIGLIILGAATESMVYVLPIAIIAVGVYILVRALIKR